MQHKNFIMASLLLIAASFACNQPKNNSAEETSQNNADTARVQPVIVTERVTNDSDDPAIWIHPDDPSKSLILGTDKGDDAGVGAIYVFDLQGNILPEKTIQNVQRPNNIDIEYGMVVAGDTFDIAVYTERYAEAIRVVRLPGMELIDNGGIKVFGGEVGEEFTSPMGVSLYKKPGTHQIFAIVGRKNGPAENYLWQYNLYGENGIVSGEKVREFGKYSGKNEIEAIAVDDALGYVYYSDEGAGIRKYYADPDSSNIQLAFFGQEGFQEDHEGISIYPTGEKNGYILISDQQNNSFRVYSRYGSNINPHDHEFIAELNMSTIESDGSEVTPVALGEQFPMGMFVAMSDDGTFQIYDWRTLQEAINQSRGVVAE